MDKEVFHLRLCYWIGAIFDAVMVFPLLSPKILGIMFGIPDFNPGLDFRMISFVGAALMAGWTVLLIWADRRPLERRDILLITLYPVLSGLIVACIYGVVQGVVKIEWMVPTFVLQGLLFVLNHVAYIQSRPRSAIAANISSY